MSTTVLGIGDIFSRRSQTGALLGRQTISKQEKVRATENRKADDGQSEGERFPRLLCAGILRDSYTEPRTMAKVGGEPSRPWDQQNKGRGRKRLASHREQHSEGPSVAGAGWGRGGQGFYRSFHRGVGLLSSREQLLLFFGSLLTLSTEWDPATTPAHRPECPQSPLAPLIFRIALTIVTGGKGILESDLTGCFDHNSYLGHSGWEATPQAYLCLRQALPLSLCT